MNAVSSTRASTSPVKMSSSLSKENRNTDSAVRSAASFYKEQMDSFLKRSQLPPTEFELKNRHENLQKEAFHKYRSISVDSSMTEEERVKKSINKAYNEVRRDHKEMRSRVLIDSAIGRKNYVGSRVQD